MGAQAQPLSRYLAQAGRSITDACTSCGRCVEVCPVSPTIDLAAADGPRVVEGVLGLLREGAPLAPDAQRWTDQCNGCGVCIPACPEGINPRRMLMLANTEDAKRGGKTPHLFRKMSRAIRTMAAMQLMPPELERLLRPPPAREAPVVFYLGCNPIRTPHLLFNAMLILDALEVDYEVLGGPAACCGIIHSKWQAEIDAGNRVTTGTLQQFGSFRPEHVLSWCPSCVLHLGETLEGFRDTGFSFDHVTDFLVSRADALAARLTTPVERRVLLHAHEGLGEIGRNVAQLLSAIPGLTLVDTVLEPGYTCGGSGADRSPALKQTARAETLRRAAGPDVEVLVTLFHGCHGQLAAAEKGGAFEVLNWTDLLVEGLGGRPHEDLGKRYRMQDDWEFVMQEAEVYLEANGVRYDRAWLTSVLPEIFAQAEFKGGLAFFGAGEKEAAGPCAGAG